MPARPGSTMTMIALATAVALLAPATHAADPTGRYENGKLKATFKLNPLGAERVSVSGGTVKVKRREVKATFLDIPADRWMRLTMRLSEPLANVDDQIAIIATGDLLLKDLVSGAPIASGGEFTRGRLRIWRKDDPDRTWVVKQDQKLKMREISGVLKGLTKGTLKATR